VHEDFLNLIVANWTDQPACRLIVGSGIFFTRQRSTPQDEALAADGAETAN
jgi:hypothetical protein